MRCNPPAFSVTRQTAGMGSDMTRRAVVCAPLQALRFPHLAGRRVGELVVLAEGRCGLEGLVAALSRRLPRELLLELG
eukprot:1037890-Rhodomonas_salina.1